MVASLCTVWVQLLSPAKIVILEVTYEDFLRIFFLGLRAMVKKENLG